jgi:hypothetical protein
MSVPDDHASEVHDFREILSSPIDGELPLLVVREYLAESIESVESGEVHSRPVIVQLELVRKVITDPAAIKCTVSHGVDFSGIWPRVLLAKAKDPRLQNFVKHRLPSVA